MKKRFILGALALAMVGLSSCEGWKEPGGNKMVTGSKSYYYAYVVSQITGPSYYHIQGWAEYGPDGAYMGDGGKLGNYVGLELQLVNQDVLYYYEPGLYYLLSKNYNPKLGPALGD